jgi:outer membrane lipoprotein SlyB
VFLAGVLGACANNGVQPGYVNTSYGGATATAQTYGNPVPGGTGRVVSINDVSLRGGGGGGSNAPMIGGLLGGLGGIAIGASGGGGVGGGLLGGVLGAVGGAIAGSIVDRNAGGRGIEVTVQRDDGQTVTVAQRDDGDVQLGDRVQIVQDRSGTPKVVRDNGRQPDYGQPPAQTYQPAPQDYRSAASYPPPQDYRQPPPQDYRNSGNYYPPPQDYRNSGGYGRPQGAYGGGYGNAGPAPGDYRQAGYSRPQSTTYTPIGGGQYQQYGSGNPQPGDDPRYGTIQ